MSDDVHALFDGLRSDLAGLRTELIDAWAGFRQDVEAVRQNVATVEAHILADMSKQFASVLRQMEQTRETAFVDHARLTRVERIGEAQNDQAPAIAGLVRMVHQLADRVAKLEQGAGEA